MFHRYRCCSIRYQDRDDPSQRCTPKQLCRPFTRGSGFHHSNECPPKREGEGEGVLTSAERFMSVKTKTNGTGAVGTGASPGSGCYLLRHKTQ